MVKVEALQSALASRTALVLKKEDSPQEAMKDVEEAAYSGGLVTEATHLDRESPEQFSQQLWVENPAARDWLNSRRESLRNPLTVTDLPDLMDVLGS